MVMSFSIEFADETQEYQARIKVIGCGGSGGNAVNTMINFGLEGVEFVVVNTDAQALNANAAPTKLNIGANVTKGLGAGADPERGRKAALEDVQRIKELISGADMVFVTAGMGGGTGTGAAPIIAQLAREEGALTVGVVTKPFLFEGRQRARRAETGLAQLSEHVDTLITIPNQKLLLLGDDDLTFIDACRKADEVLYQAVKGISDLITQNGIVNVDFADVKTVMSKMGRALMGTGVAKGQNRARLAAEMAVASPLLDDISVEGATGVLINVVGGPDLKMREIQEREHHLRGEHRRVSGRERQGHRHRDRLRRGRSRVRPAGKPRARLGPAPNDSECAVPSERVPRTSRPNVADRDTSHLDEARPACARGAGAVSGAAATSPTRAPRRELPGGARQRLGRARVSTEAPVAHRRVCLRRGRWRSMRDLSR
jgi:cell division protein FtsZ